VAIECKWSAAEFDPRASSPSGTGIPGVPNYVVSADVRRPSARRYRWLTMQLVPLPALAEALLRLGRRHR